VVNKILSVCLSVECRADSAARPVTVCVSSSDESIYTASQKTIPDILAINRARIVLYLYFFGTNINETLTNKDYIIFPSHLNNVSALPCETEKHKNRIFRSNASRDFNKSVPDFFANA